MTVKEDSSKNRGVDASLPPTGGNKPEGGRTAVSQAPATSIHSWRSRLVLGLAGFGHWLPTLLCLLLGGVVLGFSAFTWPTVGGSPIGLAGAFLGMLLLATGGSSLRVESPREGNRETLMPPRTGLRAALILSLLVTIWLELDLLRGVMGANGFAAKLLPALLPAPASLAGATQASDRLAVGVAHSAASSQGANTSWPSVFIISIFIVAVTTIVLATLSAIWRIGRED